MYIPGCHETECVHAGMNVRLTSTPVKNAKRALVFCGTCLGALHAAHAQTHTYERLSVFVATGSQSAEDRRLPAVIDDMNSLGLTAAFAAAPGAGGDTTWTWQVTNTSGATLSGLRFTAFLDVDLSAPVNTFFNEAGDLINLAAPPRHIPSDRWEIGEPGYYTGELLSRAVSGALKNRSDWSTTTPDDVAFASSLNIPALKAGQTVTLTAIVTRSGQSGLMQRDTDDGSQRQFQFYALLGDDPTPAPGPTPTPTPTPTPGPTPTPTPGPTPTPTPGPTPTPTPGPAPTPTPGPAPTPTPGPTPTPTPGPTPTPTPGPAPTPTPGPTPTPTPGHADAYARPRTDAYARPDPSRADHADSGGRSVRQCVDDFRLDALGAIYQAPHAPEG